MSESRKMGMDKQFLSDSPSETGLICWAVTLDTDSYDYRRVACDLKLSDCTDNIILDFDCYKTKDIDKRINKVDRLIASLTKLRGVLVTCKETTERMGLK